MIERALLERHWLWGKWGNERVEWGKMKKTRMVEMGGTRNGGNEKWGKREMGETKNRGNEKWGERRMGDWGEMRRTIKGENRG